MAKFRNILVGVDLSSADRLAAADLKPPTREAINGAIRLAKMTDAELTFFAGIEISESAREFLERDQTDPANSVEAQATQVVNSIVADAKKEGVSARGVVRFGTAWMEIIREVLREKYDLVMVGTRDLNAPTRLLLGSTAMKLLRYCPCPVLVNKPDPDPADFNILIASDLSDVCSTAIDVAVALGQLIDTKIHLIHAIDSHIDRRVWHTGLTEQQFHEHKRELHEQAEAKLNDQLSRSDFRTLDNGVQAHVLDGPADILISEAIEEHGIDLLMMGTAARSGIPGFLVGNTAERLLPQVTCSVLAFKPEGFVSPVTLD